MSIADTTVADWIARANDASGAASLMCLRSGEAVAQTDSDWRSLAAMYTKRNDRDGARRCLNQAITIAPQQVWCFAELATLLVEAFFDSDAAAAVLGQGERNLLASDERVPGYRWKQLAEQYHKILGDKVSARRCLDKGRVGARGASDLCDIAQGFGLVLGDTRAGQDLLKSATELAAKGDRSNGGKVDAHAFWSIANAYGALGDSAEARRSLEQGLTLATDTAGCATMAKAWGQDESSIERCLAKGEEVAKSADDWVRLAEAYHDMPSHSVACRRCLNTAAKMGDESARRAVAHGLRHWLDDPAAADAISPRGTAPERLVSKGRSLAGWDSDPSSLLRRLLAASTPEIFESIASADYGYGHDDNLATLNDILATGLIPAPLGSSFHEVVALCRWGEGERVDHVERALSCTILCYDFVQLSGHTEDIVSTLAPLLESCLELGPDATADLVGLLVWLIEAELWPLEDDEDVDEDDEGADVLAARFALVLAQASIDSADQRLSELVQSVVDLEARLVEGGFMVDHERGWMCRVLYSLRDEMWQSLASEVLPAEPGPGLEHLRKLRTLIEAKPG